MKTCLQKLTTLFPYCLALLAVPVVGGELREWEDPKLTGQNNEAPHAIMVACPDARTARSISVVNNRERVKSPFYRSLNGKWKYH